MTTPLPGVPVALLWPLATAACRCLPDGTLLDDGMADRLGPDGPLTTLVEAPGVHPVTLGRRPRPARDGRGHDRRLRRHRSGRHDHEGAGAADAAAWQEALATATDGDQQFLLPYANP